MSKRQKRLERLRQNPKNVSLDELSQILTDYGFIFQQAVGSHYTFTVVIGDKTILLTIPFHRPIKSIYVKRALSLIDQVIATQIEVLEADSEDTDESDSNENN